MAKANRYRVVCIPGRDDDEGAWFVLDTRSDLVVPCESMEDARNEAREMNRKAGR